MFWTSNQPSLQLKWIIGIWSKMYKLTFAVWLNMTSNVYDVVNLTARVWQPFVKFVISEYSSLISCIISPTVRNSINLLSILSRLSPRLSFVLLLCLFNFSSPYIFHIIIHLALSFLFSSFKFMLSQAESFVLQNLWYRNMFLFSYPLPLINGDLSYFMNIFRSYKR